jgi:hypothetical protein
MLGVLVGVTLKLGEILGVILGVGFKKLSVQANKQDS